MTSPSSHSTGYRTTTTDSNQSRAHPCTEQNFTLDAEGKRLFQCGPGDAIEPQAAFGIHPAVTAALAEEPCVTMMLTPLDRQMLETADPELAMKLYRDWSFCFTNS